MLDTIQKASEQCNQNNGSKISNTVLQLTGTTQKGVFFKISNVSSMLYLCWQYRLMLERQTYTDFSRCFKFFCLACKHILDYLLLPATNKLYFLKCETCTYNYTKQINK